MSNYLSQGYEPNKPRTDGTFSLLEKVMEAKQGRYDANKAKIDQTLAIYKNQLRGRRDVDNEYISARIKEAENTINNYGNRDFSLTQTTDTLLSSLKSITEDPIIQSAILNKSKVDQYNLRVDEIKKKNNGAYSDVNFQYGLSQGGVDKYDKGEIKDIGSLNYTNYTDVNKTFTEKIKAFKDLKGDETIETPITDSDGTRRIVKKTIKGLTDSEIMAYMPNLLSPEETKQLQINGWAKYQVPNGLQLAQKDFESYSKNVFSNLDKNIEADKLEAENGNLTQEQKDRATERQKAGETNKEKYTTYFNSIDKNNIASVGGFIETVSWETNFAKMAGARTSIEYNTDTAYNEAEKLKLDYRKDSREEEKHKLEMLKLQQETGIAPSAQSKISMTTDAPSEDQDQTNPYATLAVDFNNKGKEIKGIVDNVVNGAGLDENTKKAYDIAYEQNRGKGLSEEISAKQAFEKAGLDKLYPKVHSELIKQTVERNAMGAVLTKANDAIYETYTKDADKYINQTKKVLDLVADKRDTNKTWRSVAEPLIRIGWLDDEFMPSTEVDKRAEELRQFVNSNGGLQQLKVKLADPKNKNLLSEYVNKMEKVKDLADSPNMTMLDTLNPLGIFSIAGEAQTTLLGDSKTKRNETVASNNYGVVTTQQTGTVTDEKLREQIVNAIPQEENKVPFDSKQGITIKKVTAEGKPAFQVIQSATKVGAKGNVADNRTYIVKQGDDLFGVISREVGWDAERRSVKAGEYKTSIKNENISYIDSTQTPALKKANQYIQETVGTSVMGSGVAPANYLSKQTTQKVYQAYLGKTLPKEKIDLLISAMSTNMFNKFQVESSPVAGQYGNPQWTTRVFLKKGGSPLLLSEEETNKEVLDDQILLFTKQYPQITIGESLLQYLVQNPTEIDNIIKRLQ